jgi:transketolase
MFRQQSEAYQNEVIPPEAKTFGLTAGLPVNLQSLVGHNGKIFGLDHFGYSAPAKVLDEKFGFTGQNVFEQVKELLNK